MNETVVVQSVFPGSNSRSFACRVWDGVTVFANDIRCGYLSCPDEMKGKRSYIVVNICVRGRCEVKLPDA